MPVHSAYRESRLSYLNHFMAVAGYFVEGNNEGPMDTNKTILWQGFLKR